jgi:hypothetical protein
MLSILKLILLIRQISIKDASGNFVFDPFSELVKLEMVLLGLNIHRVDRIVDFMQKLVHNLLNEEVWLV